MTRRRIRLCRFYSNGVLDTAECSSAVEAIDHAVLLVGYGEEDGALLECLAISCIYSVVLKAQKQSSVSPAERVVLQHCCMPELTASSAY